MVEGISTLLSSMYPATGSSSVNKVSQVFDYKAAQTDTKAWIDSYKANDKKLTTLKKDTADFLDSYTKTMSDLNGAAGKLTGGGIDKLLYNAAGEVTEDTVKATVNAAQAMVDEYNKALEFLGKNEGRGPGVQAQIARMSDDPAAKQAMEMVGLSVNSDGSLKLDTEAMTRALSSENPSQVALYKDIIGGSNGIAAGVQRDAAAGLRRSSASLVGYDIAQMQGLQSEDPIRSFAQSMRSSGAYGYNNMAAVGILMNMTA